MDNTIYHTLKPQIVMREYGRNVQNIILHILSLEDKTERTRLSYTLIELMRMLNPNVRQEAEYEQKLWDHLYIMAGFDLEIDSPFPAPKAEELQKKPERMAYRRKMAVGKHFGLNIEKLIEKAAEIQDEEQRYEATLQTLSTIRSFYGAWNRENLEDSTIIALFDRCSKGKLMVTTEDLRKVPQANWLQSTPVLRASTTNPTRSSSSKRNVYPTNNSRRR